MNALATPARPRLCAVHPELLPWYQAGADGMIESQNLAADLLLADLNARTQKAQPRPDLN